MLRLEPRAEASRLMSYLSPVLAAILTAIAGWHGGKLVFDHGVGLIISTKQ